jgi:hypothetical protein
MYQSQLYLVEREMTRPCGNKIAAPNDKRRVGKLHPTKE